MNTAHYIAFEGIEGSGKSTVLARVAESLRSAPHNMDVLCVREPGGTGIGEEIRGVLLNPRSETMSHRTEASLFAAGRGQLVEEVIVHALEAGKVVLSDRSAYSSLAYQGGARGLGIPAVRTINDFAINSLWPGLVVLLRVDAEVGFAREDVRDRISGEGVGFQRLIANAYEKLAEEEREKFIIVDASAPLESVVEGVTEQILKRL